MFTIRAMSNGSGYSKKYLEQSDYYSENEKVTGQWFGKGAEKLGLSGPVDSRDFESVRIGLDPQTGEKLRQRVSADREAQDGTIRSHGRNLYDFNFSAPKSLSIMAILGQDDRLVGAHDRATEEALTELERLAGVRVRVDGQNTDRTTGNLIVACYRHEDSRRLDPQIHTHCVAANMSWDEREGKWKALQASAIYEHRAYLTEVYRNALAREVEKLGYETEARKHGFEIKGVSQKLIEQFSLGSKQKEKTIAEFIEQNGRKPTDNEISVLMRGTRPDKMENISTAEVRKQQFSRLSLDDARTLANLRKEAEQRHTTVPAHSPEQSLQHALDHIFERVSVAPDHRILSEALKHGRGHLRLEELKQSFGALEFTGAIIRVGSDVTTYAALEREREMVEMVREGRAQHDAIGRNPTEVKLDRLNAEQRRVVEFVLSSRDFAVNVEGPAGAGKTTLLKGLARALQQSDRLMTAVAPTMEAVEELQKVGFRNAMTIEGLLQNKEAHPLLSNRAIIVDEASMVSGRQMNELLRLAKRYDARVVLVGDTKQIQSVEASDALRILLDEKSIASAGLRKVQRQEKREYKIAMQLMRRHPDKSLAMLERMDSIKEVGLLDRARAVAEAYREAKGDTLVVCPTHEEIARVTTAIRDDLKEREKLGPEETLERLNPQNWTEAQKRDVRNLKEGQVLVFHKGTKDAHKYEAFTVVSQDGNTVTARNYQGREIEITKKQAKCFGVFEKQEIDVAVGDWLSIQSNLRDGPYKFTNGERVKVASINAQKGIVLEDGRTLPHNFKQFNHGYAVTAHKSQGKTVDTVLVSGDRFTKELFYVAASRGRKHITVFTGDKEYLRESIGVSGQRMSALELIRKQARMVDRTRGADRTRTAERPRTLVEVIGKTIEKLWMNIPRLVFGQRYAPEHQGMERGR